MKKNFNLYKFLPVEFQDRISFSQTIQLLIYILGALLALHIFAKMQLSFARGSFEDSTYEKRQQQESLRLLEKRYPKVAKSVELQIKRDDTKEILHLHKELNKSLAQPNFSNDEGFSTLFLGLARQAVPDAWLTEINVQKGGTVITLNGITKSVESVRKFRRQLSKDEAYKQHKVKINRTETSTISPGNDDFSIGIARIEEVKEDKDMKNKKQTQEVQRQRSVVPQGFDQETIRQRTNGKLKK